MYDEPVGPIDPGVELLNPFNRKVGIEIETKSCSGAVNNTEIGADIKWGVKEDCSIAGLEFVSKPVSGPQLLEAIQVITSIARDGEWEVDARCGLHVHLDHSHYSSGIAFPRFIMSVSTFLYFQPLLWIFVAPSRLKSRFSLPLTQKLLLDFSLNPGHVSRRLAVNPVAYQKHKTLEIRLHHGSLNAMKIFSWCTLNLAIQALGETFNHHDEVKSLLGVKESGLLDKDGIPIVDLRAARKLWNILCRSVAIPQNVIEYLSTRPIQLGYASEPLPTKFNNVTSDPKTNLKSKYIQRVIASNTRRREKMTAK